MESPGKYLKAQRESRHLSLEEVSESTRIRRHVLKAIEEDQYELLPSVYLKGFLNTYAKYLGLNPSDMILTYQKYLGNKAHSEGGDAKLRITSSKFKQCITLPGKRRKLRLLIISIFALFVLIAVYYVSLNPVDHSLPFSERIEPALTPSPSAILPESLPFEVLEAGLGTGIERKDDFLILTGKQSEFVCNNERVYFLTRIKADREGKLVHVWLCKDREFYRQEIEIRPPGWSIYSFIVLRFEHAGDWKTEVRHDNKVLATLGFKAIESISQSIPNKR